MISFCRNARSQSMWSSETTLILPGPMVLTAISVRHGPGPASLHSLQIVQMQRRTPSASCWKNKPLAVSMKRCRCSWTIKTHQATSRHRFILPKAFHQGITGFRVHYGALNYSVHSVHFWGSPFGAPGWVPIPSPQNSVKVISRYVSSQVLSSGNFGVRASISSKCPSEEHP